VMTTEAATRAAGLRWSRRGILARVLDPRAPAGSGWSTTVTPSRSSPPPIDWAKVAERYEVVKGTGH
jgi:hypothetical protein